MANAGQESDPLESSWEDDSKASSAKAAENGPEAPAKAGGLQDLKPLVPRKRTMMGLGAVKPPTAPLPTPLQGISGAMQRPPTKEAPAVRPPPKAAPNAPPKAAPTPPPTPKPAAPASSMTAEPKSPVETPAAGTASPTRAEAPGPRAPAKLPESPTTPVATAPPAPTAGAAADAEDLEITTDLGEEEDPTDPAKAYVSPRAVPKAALPVAEEAAKVVINIPTPAATTEEITQAIDKDALERQRLREEQRRREPTVRIPRKDVQAVREEIAAREALARSGGGPSTSPEHPGSVRPVAAPIARGAREVDPIASARAVPPTRDFEAIAPVETRSGSKAPILLVVVALAAAGAGGFWFMNRSSAPLAPPANPAVAANQPVHATTATAVTPAAPPLQLTAEPASTKADPNAITLDAEAASAPGTAPSVEQRPVTLPPPTNAGVAPPALSPTHAPQPVAPQPPPVKPVTTPKPFTPQSI